MRNRLKFTAIAAALMGSLLLCAQSVPAADTSGPPPLSKAVAKPLKAAEDQLKAKNYDGAIANIKEAQAVPERSPYENYLINEMLAGAYAHQSPPNLQATAAALEANLNSQYLEPNLAGPRTKLLAQIAYQTKDYNKAADFANQAIKRGMTDADVYNLLADSYYLQAKYKDAAATLQDIVNREEQNGQKPDEKSLEVLWQCYNKLGDEANVAKIIDKLVGNYPKPEYWQNAVVSLLRTKNKSDHLQLDVYRLEDEVGILKLPTDYTDMAELAIVQGYPGEAVRVLQEALSKNVYSVQTDKDHAQRVLAAAQKNAATDQSQLPKLEQDAANAATGDSLVQAGAAYLSYGQFEKAVAAINRGIAKGGLKYPEESYLLLGIAQLKAHNMGEANRAFDKVQGDPDYVRLGKLWSLHAKDAKA